MHLLFILDFVSLSGFLRLSWCVSPVLKRLERKTADYLESRHSQPIFLPPPRFLCTHTCPCRGGEHGGLGQRPWALASESPDLDLCLAASSWVIFHELVNLSGTQFSHLWNGGCDISDVVGAALHEYILFLIQFLAHSVSSMNGISLLFLFSHFLVYFLLNIYKEKLLMRSKRFKYI